MELQSVNFLAGDSLGWVASLLASFTWSFSVLIYRYYGVGYSATWLNLFKGFIALIFFGVATALWGVSPSVSSTTFWTLAVSGVVGVVIGDSAFFAALIRIGGTMTAAIQSLAPSLTAIFAWFFLAEELTLAQVSGLVITSICLVILVIKQAPRSERLRGDLRENSSNGYRTGVGFAIIAAIGQAVGAVIAKPVIQDLSAMTASSLRLWAPVLLLFIWQIRKTDSIWNTIHGLVTGRHVLPLAIGSFAGTFIGLILMTYGMARAPLGVVLALTSTYPVWIMLIEQVTGRSEIGKSGLALVLGSVAGIWLMV